MINGTVRFLVAGALVNTLLAAGCSVPHKLASKEDVLAREWNDPTAEKRVLISSRSSEFKNEVVERIEEQLRGKKDVYVKVIGVEALEQEDAAPYRAVVLVNTCVAWKMDPEIESFLEKHPESDRIIVLTTSGDGEWKPKKDEQAFDTVTSASKDYDPDAVADQIVERVGRLLETAPAN